MKNLKFLLIALSLSMSVIVFAQNDQVYARVGNMPTFPGCEEYKSSFSKNDCSDELMNNYIYENLKYPESARNADLTGKVMMQFVVRRTGEITDIKLLESLSADCDAEAIRVIQSMNEMEQKWMAGAIRDKKVSVRLEISIYFEAKDAAIEEDVTFDDNSSVPNIPPPPPPPPYDEVEVIEGEEGEFDQTFTIVEVMPIFPGCEELSDKDEQKLCTERNLLKYMYQNIKYPTIARENGIEGLVLIQFVIKKDGSVSDVSILKGIGGGCDEEAARVVESMNTMPQKWTPGKQRGKPVRVRYNLPISFKLAADDVVEEETEASQEDEIFLTVDNMPVFPSCTKLTDEDERDNCSDKNMKKYITDNLQYPLDALENDVEGSVVVQFVVTETGNIANIKILKSLSKSCDVEAYRVVNSMNSMSEKWQSGVHKRDKVKVQYTVPVYFNLSGMTEKQKRKLIKKLKKG